MKFKLSMLLGFTMLMHGVANADGMVVDKVYHPYVLPYEQEFEW